MVHYEYSLQRVYYICALYSFPIPWATYASNTPAPEKPKCTSSLIWGHSRPCGPVVSVRRTHASTGYIVPSLITPNLFIQYTHMGKFLIRLPEKHLSASKPTCITLSHESLLQRNFIMTSLNLVLRFYTYTERNREVSS
jgi:hypothetical protein